MSQYNISDAFTSGTTIRKHFQSYTPAVVNTKQLTTTTTRTSIKKSCQRTRVIVTSSTVPDLDVIALVVGQENYGLALVAVGEGLYSFLQSPNLANLKVLIPPVVAAVLLVAVSGPLITNGSDMASVGTGLWIATGVSMGLGACYLLRLFAPPSDSFVPKEIAALGLLVAVAGFFSFSQNLLVDGFVQLPDIPFPEILPMPPSDNGI